MFLKDIWDVIKNFGGKLRGYRIKGGLKDNLDIYTLRECMSDG
jgi:hypothetical protein